jgi:hypothetical protein
VFRNRMGTWKRFWNLSSRDRRAALEAAAVIVSTRVALRSIGHRRWMALLAGSASPNTADILSRNSRQESIPVSPAGLARMTAGAARTLFFHPTCLERSIGLWWSLRRNGFAAEIHIGGRKDGGRFEAHAWVECAGAVLNDLSGEYLEFAAFSNSNPRPAAAREVH